MAKIRKSARHQIATDEAVVESANQTPAEVPIAENPVAEGAIPAETAALENESEVVERRIESPTASADVPPLHYRMLTNAGRHAKDSLVSKEDIESDPHPDARLEDWLRRGIVEPA